MLKNNKYHNFFSIWLVSLLTLVALIIAVGGLTRLTESGLSITKWELFSGILPPFTVVEWENNKYVLNENLEALRKVKVKEYLIAKQEICKRYGFKATNAIAICVQKEMSNDRLYANSQNQQNVPRSSINYKAISELGAVFSEQAKNRAYTQNQAMKKTYFLKNNYMDGMNRVCVYDGWTETINGIGLCKLTIKR
mgnify:CR=1 FL=1